MEVVERQTITMAQAARLGEWLKQGDHGKSTLTAVAEAATASLGFPCTRRTVKSILDEFGLAYLTKKEPLPTLAELAETGRHHTEWLLALDKRDRKSVV